MRTMARDKNVIVMAQQLGVACDQDPVPGIVNFCVAKIKDWVAKRPSIGTIADVEKIVCRKLHLLFEEIWTDQDLQRIIAKYVSRREIVFASLRNTFDPGTYAALFDRKEISKRRADRYVAVIDCRGPKGARRFFSRWHEIAHLLTCYTQLEFPFHRSCAGGGPIEHLMDQIAGEIGFYDPLFRPLLGSELVGGRNLSFGAVENVRERFSSEASFQATLIACIARSTQPLVYLEAGPGYKKAEQEKMKHAEFGMSCERTTPPKLRALTVVPNAAARNGRIYIHRNMQIPRTSVIARLFDTPPAPAAATAHVTGTENLSTWRHSDGTRLQDIVVMIEAERVGANAIAIVSPIVPDGPAAQ